MSNDDVKYILSYFPDDKTEGTELSHEVPFFDLLADFIGRHFDRQLENKAIVTYFAQDLLQGRGDRQQRFVKLLHKHLGDIMNMLELRLNEEIAARNVRDIKFSDLLLSIMPLNIAPFVIANTFKGVLGMKDKGFMDVKFEPLRHQTLELKILNLHSEIKRSANLYI